jgi:hypothetical protein
VDAARQSGSDLVDVDCLRPVRHGQPPGSSRRLSRGFIVNIINVLF